MNQITNKVPYGLLSKEEQAQFSGEAKNRGMYELYRSCGWSESITDMDFVIDGVYRLIIKDDEWYWVDDGDVWAGAVLGESLRPEAIECYDILRPATLAEIQAAKPKVESLEDRVKADYGDYEVVMLTVKKGTGWLSYDFSGMNRVCHITAQSNPGFQGYVYEDGHYEFRVSLRPVHGAPIPVGGTGPVYPIAVLFTK